MAHLPCTAAFRDRDKKEMAFDGKDFQGLGGGVRHFVNDVLGSVTALLDANGTVQTSYTYQPFGQVVTSGASSPNPLAFTGREVDSSGLMYFRARYYAPALHRFIGEDPIGFLGKSVNLHEYTYDNPLRYIDPTGQQLIDIFIEDPVVIDPDLIELARTVAKPKHSLPTPEGGRLDIDGEPHHIKPFGPDVPTPHVHEPLPPFDEPYANIPRGLNPEPRPATPEDIWDAIWHRLLFPSAPPLGGRKPKSPQEICQISPNCA